MLNNHPYSKTRSTFHFGNPTVVSVVVEYDGEDGRETKEFDKDRDARKFYAAMISSGKNPRISKVNKT